MEKISSGPLSDCFLPDDVEETIAAERSPLLLWPLICPGLLASSFQVSRYLTGLSAQWGLIGLWLLLMLLPILAKPLLASTLLQSPPDFVQVSKTHLKMGFPKTCAGLLVRRESRQGEANVGDPILAVAGTHVSESLAVLLHVHQGGLIILWACVKNTVMVSSFRTEYLSS